MVKHEVIPKKIGKVVPQCSSSEDKLCDKVVDLVKDFQISAPEVLLDFQIKAQCYLNVNKFFDKYGFAAEPEEDTLWNEFVEELNHWDFVPTLVMIFFVYYSITLY